MDRTIIRPFNEIEYKIYGYTLPEVPNHDGYVKIGDTTRDATERIFEQVGTAGLNPNILFEKLAKKSDGTWFRDKELHRFLLLNGIEKKDFNNRADEWFYFNGYLEKAEELTDKFINMDYDEVQKDDGKTDYILRSEQQLAVEKTLEYYRENVEPREFLWNAKPRFGKTLTTYDFIRNIRATNVLIVTNRPAIANSWYDDFRKFIAWQEPQMKFVSETAALNGKTMNRAEYIDFINTTTYEKPCQIVFMSLQDLKGAQFAGGPYKKLEWIPGLHWDLLVIDEAHEGVDTRKTNIAFSQIKRDFTLHLSGTPFKALASNKFSEKQIFNWSYTDEQEAKQNWDSTIGSNPYENLPTLNLFTYQMSKIIEEEVTEGLSINDEQNVDYAFDLNEFFKVSDNGRFVYEESVNRFLDNLTMGKFPFAKKQYRAQLNHTFWLLPRVNAAKALEKLLKKHHTFKEYKVVLAAGDGVSLHDTLEEEALDFQKNKLSFDKVKKAISENEKTITLSVGQLTTGVTIPEWTAVFMLNNIKSPSLYFQAAFRAQNPYEYEMNGKLFRKENAYIFDFSPDRTLVLYDEFANNLSGGMTTTTVERKNKIKHLLNFFPVIAEDEDGSMHEIDATEVITIPTRITSREVVKRGFMSNLLFENISGIFSGHSLFKEILEKIPPEKNQRLGKRKEIEVTDPPLNEDGEIDVPQEIVIGKSKDIFGDKIYAPIDNIDQIMSSIDSPESENKNKIKELADNITESFSDGFNLLRETFELTNRQKTTIEKEVNQTIEEILEEKTLTLVNDIKEIDRSFWKEIEIAKHSNDEEQIDVITGKYEEKKKQIENSFKEEIEQNVTETINKVVEERIEKVEENKKKKTEDDVRDHLRGFSRTIPAFLMAYGDEETTLANFDKKVDEATFEELTSITIDEFKKLRDGFKYVDDDGNERNIPGLFNEVVFNASIREFLDTKKRLANYFDETIEEDIFDYIPPQKTNQIFTPKSVVKKMVETLEKENPEIFRNKYTKFADLYTKSGLFLTELVKKLNDGLKTEIPSQKKRIKWILENQIYACAPSNIIYNIVKEFVFNELEDVSRENLRQVDTMELANNEELANNINKIFGDDHLKFDVIIGNPPYQNEGIGEMARDEPIYHKFLEESYKIADIVSFITPARFLFNAGQTPKRWNEKMLNDEHLKVVFYETISSKVFPNTDVKGGIAITLRNTKKRYGKIGTFISNPLLKRIAKKTKSNMDNSISDIHFNRSSYRLTDRLYKENVSLKNINKPSEQYMISSNIFSKMPEVFLDEVRNDETKNKYVQVFGRENNRRVYKYIKCHYIESHPNLDKWKVFLAKSNGTGQMGEKLSSPEIGKPNTIATQTFISFGSFDSDIEAKSLFKYLKCKFTRLLLNVKKITPDNARKDVWEYVPMQDFTQSSDIDWSKSISEIDQQLYKKYNLNEEEIKFIEENVQSME